MKSFFLITIALIFIAGPALTQSQRLSRTHRRPHTRVDSVSTWAHGVKDTAHAPKDTARRR
jgi:hypothetical protein